MFGQHEVLGGYTHQHRHAALSDQLKDPAGFEAAFQHHGGSGPPRQQRLDVPAADVELRQHGQDDVGAAHVQRPGQGQVGPETVRVRQHCRLARTLGPGREDHQEGIVVAHFPLTGPGPRLPHGATGTRRHGHGLFNSARAQSCSPRPVRKQPARGGGERVQLAFDQEQLRIGDLKLGGKLLGREPPGQRDQDQPGLGTGKEGHHMVRAVAGETRDPVPDRVTGGTEPGSKSRGTAFQLAVEQGAAAVVDGDPVRRGKAAVGGPAAQGVQAVGLVRTGRVAHAASSRMFWGVSIASP